MIKQMGAVGGAWFWVGQAIVLVPMMRLPLIYQEIGNLGFAAHVWQPLLSGVVASLAGAWLLFASDWSYAARISLSMLAFVFVYAGLFLLLDRKSLGELKRIWQRSIEHRKTMQ